MVITFSFKVDDLEDPELIKWLKSFSKTDRVRSYHIRQALKAYIKGSVISPLSVPVSPVVPVLSGNPPGTIPSFGIETGEMFTENPGGNQGMSEAELLALLDNQF